MIARMICCASRWHEVASERGSALRAAIDRPWIRLFGSMEILIVGDEGGMASTYIVEDTKRKG
eukprot:2014366-Pyramimonas_sp.AAC.1